MLPLKTSLFFCLLSICVAEPQSSDNGGFLFTIPKALRSGRRETGCLSLHGTKSDIKADVTINIESIGPKKNSAITKKTFDAENVGCFEVRIPETNNTKAKLHLQIKFSNDENQILNKIEDVYIFHNSDVTFIQTDKRIYKSGDRVKIRILILNSDLGVPKNLMIPIVKIRNPNNIAIGLWENVTTELGLVQLEHQLSQDTVTGQWRIELTGNNNFQTFEVKEYILPRFEVDIQHSESVYIDDESFNFTVCSRYSYGRPIKGTCNLNVEINIDNSLVQEINEELNLSKTGCAEFIVNRSDLMIRKTNYYFTYLGQFLLTAIVKEHGTGQTQLKKSSVGIRNEKYLLEFAVNNYFQPGFPFRGQVKINNKFIEIENNTLDICYTVALNTIYNYTKEICRKFQLQNVIDFVIFPFYENAISIQLKATIQNESVIFDKPNVIYKYMHTWNSPSNSYIQINYEPRSIPIKCKAWQTFTVLYTINATSNNITKHPPIIFNYLLKSKGNIIKFGKVSHAPCLSHTFDSKDYKNVIGNTTNMQPLLPIDKFILTLKIHQKMYSEGQLIVYYVRDDGEIVGTSINFEVENCLANKVEANWSDKQRHPGEKSTYKIKAASGSLCAVSAIDKKVSILSPPETFQIEKFLKQVKKPHVFDSPNDQNCKEEAIPYWDLKRKKRSFDYDRIDFDTYQIFNEAELLVITDLDIIHRTCSGLHSDASFSPEFDNSGSGTGQNLDNSPSAIFMDSMTPYHTQGTDKGVPVRFFFPETWLWELIPIGRSGETQLEKELPHSITQWQSNTFCISPSAGIGFSQLSIITTFKPFFVDIITPYSIKRNEISHLKIIVYNYLNHSLPVAITLGLNKNMMVFAGSSKESFITTCIGPNDAFVDSFRVTALTLGKVNFSITAEVDGAYPGECGPEVLVNRKDVIEKSILVQAEGFLYERTLSNFVCENNDTKETIEDDMKWNVEVPNDSVKNSSRLKILLDADLLGLTVENLGSLLDQPTGCGEQIMATLSPNLYVLHYLKTTGNLSSNIEEKALNFIRIGYQKILKYRHRDGSFSAFGERYEEGSMFLTAFVVRTLSQASEYVYIDDNIIKSAAAWILEKQFENGCFPRKSHVFQSAMMEENEQENIPLTAYVLISLMESKLSIPLKVQENAKYCLRTYNSADKYTMAIISYALSLVHWESEAVRSQDKLLEIANRKNGLLWLEDTDSLSTSLEMTSYMILSLLYTKDSRRIALAHEAVRWLLTKRNSNGGFVTTHDTVVAIDALTKFALIAGKQNVDASIYVATAGKQYGFRMRSKAKLKTKQITLTKFSNYVKFKVNGTGCVLIQTILRYNMVQIVSSEALKLAISVNPVSNVDTCTITQLNPCFSYTIPNKQINMAVMEISLPSGFRADRSSLFALIQSDTKIQRFEEVDDKVIFYFTKVSDEKLCVPFLINEESVVQNRTDAVLRLYDYYNPEVSVSESYKLTNCDPIDLSI